TLARARPVREHPGKRHRPTTHFAILRTWASLAAERGVHHGRGGPGFVIARMAGSYRRLVSLPCEGLISLPCEAGEGWGGGTGCDSVSLKRAPLPPSPRYAGRGASSLPRCGRRSPSPRRSPPCGRCGLSATSRRATTHVGAAHGCDPCAPRFTSRAVGRKA